MHGYDVVDPNRLNPALGTEDDFETMVGALQQRGMGLLVDIVPNHMAASPENVWWMDVLENGPASPYATYFGINWRAAGIKSRTRSSCQSWATRTGPCSIAERFASRTNSPGSFSVLRAPVADRSVQLCPRAATRQQRWRCMSEFASVLLAIEQLPLRVATNRKH